MKVGYTQKGVAMIARPAACNLTISKKKLKFYEVEIVRFAAFLRTGFCS